MMIIFTQRVLRSLPHRDDAARMVISKSGKRPHLVTPKKNGSMTCDSDCPHYKSAGICSHVVATAISTDRLCELIAAVTKVKRTPSLHMLAYACCD